MNVNLAVLPASNLGEAFWASQKSELRLIHYTTRKPWECGHVEKVYAKVCETWQRYELESRGPRQPVEAAGSGGGNAAACGPMPAARKRRSVWSGHRRRQSRR